MGCVGLKRERGGEGTGMVDDGQGRASGGVGYYGAHGRERDDGMRVKVEGECGGGFGGLRAWWCTTNSLKCQGKNFGNEFQRPPSPGV